MTEPIDLGYANNREAIANYFAELNAQRQKTEEILSSGQFIDWLEAYTFENPIVSTPMMDYEPEFRDSPDREIIDCLPDFVVSVYDYFDRNYIDVGREYPHVTHNGVTYEVTAMYGQGSFHNVKRVAEPALTPLTVEYADVLAEKKTKRAKEIDKKLHKLGNRILGLVDEYQIPENAILKTVNGAFLAIKLDETLKED